MVKQIPYLILVAGLITGSGCATSDSSGDASPPAPVPNGQAQPPDPAWMQCKKLTKALNSSLISSVRAALKKLNGTPVQTMEVIEAGQRVYHVKIIDQQKQTRTITVEQQIVDAEKVLEPSSLQECKAALLNAKTKEEKIITAMRLAQQKVPGRPVKAQFGKYEDRFLYTVTMEDTKGGSQLVRVDADARQIVKIEPE